MMRDLTITYAPGDGSEWLVTATRPTLDGITSVYWRGYALDVDRWLRELSDDEVRDLEEQMREAMGERDRDAREAEREWRRVG